MTPARLETNLPQGGGPMTEAPKCELCGEPIKEKAMPSDEIKRIKSELQKKEGANVGEFFFMVTRSDIHIILDELQRAEAAFAPGTPPICSACNGRGEVGGFVNTESGYQTDPCPVCASPAEMEKALKPCPFCGVEPESNTYFAWCHGPDDNSHGPVQLSLEHWNQRFYPAYSDTKLMPCPHCLGKAEVAAPYRNVAICAECGSRGPISASSPEAIVAWNRRAEAALQAGQAAPVGVSVARKVLSEMASMRWGCSGQSLAYVNDWFNERAATALSALAATPPAPTAAVEAHWLRKNAVLVRELGPSMSPGALAAAMERRAEVLETEAQIAGHAS